MNVEKSKKYIHLILGYTGVLLIALVVFRSMSVLHDTTGYVLSILGFICLSTYFEYADKKIGATRIESVAFRIGFLIILGIIVFSYI